MMFSGTIGFQEGEEEIKPGIWKPKIVEKKYLGYVYKSSRRYLYTDKQNPDLTTTTQISILSDLYARANWQSICYVIWNGVKWSVSNVDLAYPRLQLDLGGIYNENKRKTSSDTM